MVHIFVTATRRHQIASVQIKYDLTMIHPIVKICLTTYQEIKMKATWMILTQVAL